jgi:hypothetical protein
MLHAEETVGESAGTPLVQKMGVQSQDCQKTAMIQNG